MLWELNIVKVDNLLISTIELLFYDTDLARITSEFMQMFNEIAMQCQKHKTVKTQPTRCTQRKIITPKEQAQEKT